MRVQYPALTGRNQREIENRLRGRRGIDSVQANPDTGNVLIRFSPGQISDAQVLEAVRSLAASDAPESAGHQERLLSPIPAAPPAVQ